MRFEEQQGLTGLKKYVEMKWVGNKMTGGKETKEEEAEGVMKCGWAKNEKWNN